MGKLVALFVCVLIISLDIAAGFCGIQAETAQNKVKHLKLWIFECRMKPSEQAYKLGLGATGLLILAHIISNLFGASSCFCSPHNKPSSIRHLTTACFVFSWLIVVVGVAMLVMGTRANHKERASCGFTDHHMLSIGGILCFVHALFSTAFCASATSGGGH